VEGNCTKKTRPNPGINASPFKDKPYLDVYKDLIKEMLKDNSSQKGPVHAAISKSSFQEACRNTSLIPITKIT